jgi:hypothetical protein
MSVLDDITVAAGEQVSKAINWGIEKAGQMVGGLFALLGSVTGISALAEAGARGASPMDEKHRSSVASSISPSPVQERHHEHERSAPLPQKVLAMEGVSSIKDNQQLVFAYERNVSPYDYGQFVALPTPSVGIAQSQSFSRG